MDHNEKSVRQIPLKLLIASALFIIALLLFFTLMKIVVLDQKDLFDQRVFNFFESLASDGLHRTMKLITFFGDTKFLLPAYCILVAWLLFRKKIRWAIDISIIGLTGELMKQVLKHSFARPRPELPVYETLQSFSFPSGHALSSFIFAACVIYLLWHGHYKTHWRWIFSMLLVVYALAVGMSRVILRYHYASDVLAGFCIGFAWVMCSLYVLDKFYKSRAKK
ncbi:MAG: phosphatase PAP2 family protein [Flavisolibacter sp.]|jgi:undecaprenyl-diphosphatase|nr:phosphatase PAP2 family protein [Flavisolibacter sp.]